MSYGLIGFRTYNPLNISIVPDRITTNLMLHSNMPVLLSACFRDISVACFTYVFKKKSFPELLLS